MNAILDRRLAKLECSQNPSGAIPVWCDSRADVQRTIAAMIADGEILPDDTGLCVYWADCRNFPPGEHERALSGLDAL